MQKLVGVLFLLLGAASCQKLDSGERGNLNFQPLQLKDSIPAEFGELEGVTTNDARPNVAQLWFKKEDGSVVMVAVNFIDGKLAPNALTISRK